MASRRRAVLAIAAAVMALASAAAPRASAGADPGRTAPLCHGHRATIYGPGVLVGTSKGDVIVGTLLDGYLGQKVSAGGGDDLVCSGPAGAHLLGGRGDDRLFGHGGGVRDILDGGPGDDLLDPGSGLGPCCADEFSFHGSKRGVIVDLKEGLARGEGHDRLVVTPGADSVEGSAHHDRLLGTNAADMLYPGDGDDVVRGRGGDDVIGDNGDDTLYGGAGDDSISTCNGTIFGGSGADDLHAGWDVYSCEQPAPGTEPVSLFGGPGADDVLSAHSSATAMSHTEAREPTSSRPGSASTVMPSPSAATHSTAIWAPASFRWARPTPAIRGSSGGPSRCSVARSSPE